MPITKELASKAYEMRYETSRWVSKRVMDLVWMLPRHLVYLCAIRLISHATTGEYCNQIVPDLKATDALDRWEKK